MQVDFETNKSDEINKNNYYLDENLKEQFKTRMFENQWFGVSLASTGSGSFAVIYLVLVHFFAKKDRLINF